MGDLGEVGGVELDPVEAVLPPRERLADRDPLGAGHGVAKEVLEVALPGDERHHRHGSAANAGLDEFGDLRSLGLDERGVAEVGREP